MQIQTKIKEISSLHFTFTGSQLGFWFWTRGLWLPFPGPWPRDNRTGEQGAPSSGERRSWSGPCLWAVVDPRSRLGEAARARAEQGMTGSRAGRQGTIATNSGPGALPTCNCEGRGEAASKGRHADADHEEGGRRGGAPGLRRREGRAEAERAAASDVAAWGSVQTVTERLLCAAVP